MMNASIVIHHANADRITAPECPVGSDRERALWATQIPVLPILLAEIGWERGYPGIPRPLTEIRDSDGHDGFDSPWRNLAAESRQVSDISPGHRDSYFAPYRARVDRYEAAIAAGLPLRVVLHQGTGEMPDPVLCIAVNEDGSRGAILDRPRQQRVMTNDEAEGFVLGNMRHAL